MHRRSPFAAAAVAAALVLGGLAWSVPAGSQTDCSLHEAYTNPSGGDTPIISDTTPFISFTVTNPSSVAFVVDPANAVFCDAHGQDRNPSTGEIQAWQLPAGTAPADLKHQAPAGFVIHSIVVRARLASTTTSVSTSTTSSTTTTTNPSSTTSTTTSTPTTTSTTTSTTTTSTTTTTLPRGPGNGPVDVRPDPIVRTSPDAASVRGHPRLDVVVGGPDGHVYWTFQNQTPWSTYFDLGSPPGGIVGNPTITSWGPGRLDVFARGADNRLWQTYSENGGQTWVNWLRPFGEDNVLASGAGVSTRGPNRLNVYHLGLDGNIYERYYDGAWNDRWLNQGRPDVGVSSDPNGRDPAPVSWQGADTERIDLFVRGNDNRLWQKYWDGSSWSPWLKPVGDDGLLGSEPAAMSWAPGTLVIFVRGVDDRAHALAYGTGGWATWQRLVRHGDTWQSGPGATGRSERSFDLFLRGTDNVLYHVWQ